MIFHTILFYMFAAVLIGAALGVVFARNPVHSIMFLVLAFFQSACLWLLAEAEFLAIVLVLVYVGAVMVLFLFVIMMLEVTIEAGEARADTFRAARDRDCTDDGRRTRAAHLAAQPGHRRVRWNSSPYPEGYSNTKALGSVLYTEHVYAFEIAAVILLLAIVAAITLTMRKRPGLKQQNISAQVAVRARDRIRIVKMDAEKKQ